MNTQTTTSEYLLLGRGTHWDKGLSPEEIQKVMRQSNAWFDRLSQQGKAKAGQPLAHEGKLVSGKKGRSVTDGPFAESKEAIAGYILLQVDDLDEALEIAKQWPVLEIYGVSIEVRPVNASRDGLSAWIRRPTDMTPDLVEAKSEAHPCPAPGSNGERHSADRGQVMGHASAWVAAELSGPRCAVSGARIWGSSLWPAPF